MMARVADFAARSQELKTGDVFIPAALQAASCALAAVAAGHAFNRDDLIAGATALEEYADRDERAGLIMARLRAAMVGLRILATRTKLAGSPAGRAAAAQFALTVRCIQQSIIN